MPIYEYTCRACGHPFELLVLKQTAPGCPACGSADLERRISAPAVKSDATHANALSAAKRRDTRQASEKNRAQREYETHHND